MYQELDRSNLDTCEKIILWEPFDRYLIPNYVKK